MSDTAASSDQLARWPRLKRWAIPAVVVLGLALALRLLEREVSHLRYHQIEQAFLAVPGVRLWAALLATIAAYLALPGYDVLALRYAGHPLPWRRVAFGSTVTYGISQTLGFAALTGGSLRVRLWSAWGLSTSEITKAVAFSGTTFLLGMVALTGLAGVTESSAALDRLHLPIVAVRGISALFLVMTGLYVAWSVFAPTRTIRVWRQELDIPMPITVAAQLLVAVVDWSLAALVLYVLLPTSAGLSFPALLMMFLLAHVGGLISHVPGGLGVFEAMMVMQVGSAMPIEMLLGSLLAYRLIFYALPFFVALAMLVYHEGNRERRRLARAGSLIADLFERWAEPLLPVGVGTMTAVGGAILLLSGATPSAHGRLAALFTIIPLSVVELSHFAGSLVGTGLLVLGWALTRRLDAAFHLARALLVTGIAASLLKGLDVEEAVALAVVLALLQSSRDAFYRRSSLLAEPLTPGWLAGIGAILAVSVWVGLFSYRHVDYSYELWWQFAERGDVPRFLRASAGAAALLGVLGTLRLLRHAPPQDATASPDAVERVAAMLPTIDETSAALALLGDKQLLFAESGAGYLMYGVSGRSWVALGDPFGTSEAQRELVWRFRELADIHGAYPVFYEVSSRYLPLYIDLGLTLLKMGEEAIVPLTDFSLEGPARRGLRRTQRELQKAGASVEIVPAGATADIMPALRSISDEWLAAKSTREKGFSLGRFDERYLEHFPQALVRVDGRIVAFANLWIGSGREVSVDLMRFASDAPRGVMEFLFIELMLWGRANGFERMSLGMAPLSGLESQSLAPRWHRFGALVYRHGEHFYNFQGLRAYKEKFEPRWEPRYLATPAGLALPRILANVTSLISGGVSGLFLK